MIVWALAAWGAEGEVGVGLVGGLCAGGPAVGLNLAGQARFSQGKLAPFVQGELAVLGHGRSYGTYDLLIAAPMAQAGAWYGGDLALGPVLRLDALVGGADEQFSGQGAPRYSSLLDDPLLVTAYPSAGVSLRQQWDGGSALVASLTMGPPFSSFDVFFPFLPSPMISWSHTSGTHLALRATRYQVTAEVGRRF